MSVLELTGEKRKIQKKIYKVKPKKLYNLTLDLIKSVVLTVKLNEHKRTNELYTEVICVWMHVVVKDDNIA